MPGPTAGRKLTDSRHPQRLYHSLRRHPVIQEESPGTQISFFRAFMNKGGKEDRSSTLSDDSESRRSLPGNWQRVVSLFIATAYVLLWPIVFPPKSLSHLMGGFLIRTLSLAFPLACIWFGDDIGEYYRDGRLFPEITGPSPGRFVRWGGWMLLLLPVLIVLLGWLLDYLYVQ